MTTKNRGDVRALSAVETVEGQSYDSKSFTLPRFVFRSGETVDDAVKLWRAAVELGHPDLQAQLLRFDLLDAFALTPAYCLCAFFAFRSLRIQRRLALLPLATFLVDELENAVTYLYVVKLNPDPIGLMVMQALTLVKWIGIVGIISTLVWVIFDGAVHWINTQLRGR